MKKMKALSLNQANRCETAEGKVCHCRCGGMFHGAKRINAVQDGREAFEQLDEHDPHHLPIKPIKKKREKKTTEVKKPLTQMLLFNFDVVLQSSERIVTGTLDPQTREIINNF